MYRRTAILVLLLCVASSVWAQQVSRKQVLLGVKKTEAVAGRARMADVLDTQYGTHWLITQTQSTNRSDWADWAFSAFMEYEYIPNTNIHVMVCAYWLVYLQKGNVTLDGARKTQIENYVKVDAPSFTIDVTANPAETADILLNTYHLRPVE